MKKFVLFLVLISLLTLNMTGCFGNFVLTRKLYDFNSSLGDKWVNTIVMWAAMILPVYWFAAAIDVMILNLIEFWTGSNPLAMNEGDMERRLYAHDGQEYELVATKNRIDVVGITNPEMQFSFNFDEDSDAWYVHHEGSVYQMSEGENFFRPELMLGLN